MVARPDPRRYFEQVGDTRGVLADSDPVCLYLEITNRCNLLCATCPRTFEELENPQPTCLGSYFDQLSTNSQRLVEWFFTELASPCW